MGAVNVPGSVVRAELRRRPASLVVLALIVAIVVAAVGGALAGAHRTATSVDRFRAWADAGDGTFQLNQPGTFTELRPVANRLDRTIASTAGVAAVGQRWLVNGFFADDAPIPDIAVYSDPTDHFGRTVERPRILRGRLPRRDAPAEIALNEQAASLLHVGPGARLTVRTWSPDNLLQLFGGSGFGGFDGPVIHLRVVGVVRPVDSLSGTVERTSPYGLAGPRFLAAHPGVGPWPPAFSVRARDGADGFARVSRRLAKNPTTSEVVGTGTSSGVRYLEGVEQGATSSATGLLVFAVIAALAGALVVGQAGQRHLTARRAEGRQLVELGLSRSATATTLMVPVVVAALAGAVVGIGGAVLSSAWLPIGVAGRAEVSPGIRVDAPALLAVAAATVLAIGVAGLLWCRSRIARVGPDPAPTRRVGLAVRGALGIGARPAVATGVQLATDRSGESGPIPIRSAFAGVLLTVVAIVGTGLVVHSDDALVQHSERWGRAWDSEPDVFDGSSLDELAPRLAREPRIDAAARLGSGGVRLRGRDVSGYSLTPIRGHIAMTLLRGRQPTRADEIALGERTMTEARLAIGDRVRVFGQTRRHADLIVTGTIVLPPSAGEEHTLDNGALMARSTLRRLTGDDDFNENLGLRYPAGADTARLRRELHRDYGLTFNVFTELQVPGVVRQLADTRAIAIALAWFFAVLGLLSLVHALWVGTRRRRVHLTMLRVLGMRRSQVLTAVLIQAALLVTVAVLIGVPIGLLVGRLVWHAASDDLGAVNDAVVPVGLVLVMLPVALVVALAVAWWPGWNVSRRPPAVTLRTE